MSNKNKNRTMGTTKWFAGTVALLLAASCGNVKKETAADGDKALPEGVTVMQVDSLTLTTLQDNADDKEMPNKLFYGAEDSARVEELSPTGGVPSSISCFLVETQGKKVLFDTGNGAANGGRLLALLDSMGIAPEGIDYLLLTHFHNDHIGGMLAGDSAVFTHAEVYVPEPEYDFWVTNGDSAGNAARAMQAYAGRLHRFAWTDTLPLGIQPIAAPGHTPGHTVYRIGRLLVVGDLMHGVALQLQDLNICPAFDMDREQAVTTRKEIVDYVRSSDTELIVAGMHFPGNGVLPGLKLEE